MDRRQFLAALAGTATLTLWPGSPLRADQNTPPSRLIVIILRGALDGLSAAPAYGDKHFAALRGELNLGTPGRPGGPLKLDDTFALHPSLVHCHELYAQKAFAIVHACALPYHGRSHFDAQDCLENGANAPHACDSGWLNRALDALHQPQGLAIASGLPLLARGGAPFMTWSPTPGKTTPENLARQLEDAYNDDPALASAYTEAVRSQKMAPEQTGNSGQLAVVMEAAGKFLAEENGPHIAMVQDTGWDTHANQNAVLKRKLAQLDQGMHNMQAALEKNWSQTAVIIATEFGRTVAVNGTRGTDHGTGSVVMLAGGAINGGQVHGQWPGLATLKDDRDLMPANDIRAVFKGVLAEHLQLARNVLDSRVFPDSAAIAPITGLIRPRSRSRVGGHPI
ncbi:hypothetical protein A11A3_05649 [Alcanivorax hongdengensis A-11-3]|uniref:DUF1501 domain-containing protein n=1 Tax=Alcanivorax hongdengensis A-11-3 TaxID=1177179 RepID=L0WG70_9GAMM|nr:DUF1501 domain-containing protein [Alcanivorax hongdengensis]EKF75152.1 hypothetical protein A11A3_05649 [Alcanivorax hongdengensis A-11-3]